MSLQAPSYAPPAWSGIGPAKDFKGVQESLRKLDKYIREKESVDTSYNATLQAVINGNSNGFGADLVSAATISPLYFMHNVTGVAEIDTIAVPADFNGQLALVSQDGFSFGTTGNIGVSVIVGFGANVLVMLIYFPPKTKWYVTSVTPLNGSITTAMLANGAVTTAKVANLAITTPLIALLAVDTAQINGAAVTTAKVANLAITNPLIAATAVDTGKLASGAATASGTVTDNSSQNITPYDTEVQVGTLSVIVNATSDLVEISGRVQTTAANIQSLDEAFAVIRRGVTLIDSSDLQLTLSTATVVGGKAAGAFTFHDTGVSGAITYNLFIKIHNGSANGTYAVTKTSMVARAVDLRAQ